MHFTCIIPYTPWLTRNTFVLVSDVQPTAMSTEALLDHWRRLPPVDPAQLRADIDDTIDQRL